MQLNNILNSLIWLQYSVANRLELQGSAVIVTNVTATPNCVYTIKIVTDCYQDFLISQKMLFKFEENILSIINLSNKYCKPNFIIG